MNPIPNKIIIYGDSTSVCYSNGLQSGCDAADPSTPVPMALVGA